MKHCRTLPGPGWGAVFTVLLAALLIGCRTPNVNPPHPRDNAGYVDFYTDPSAHAYWYLARLEERSGKFKEIYSEFRPPRGGILRVAMKPGGHTFRVGFLNKVFESFWDGKVDVQDGMITPVYMQLVPAGQAMVQSFKPVTRGRVADSNVEVQTNYRIEADIQPAITYRPKEEMGYPVD